MVWHPQSPYTQKSPRRHCVCPFPVHQSRNDGQHKTQEPTVSFAKRLTIETYQRLVFGSLGSPRARK